MPTLNLAFDVKEEIAGWRRQLHAKPELLYEVHETEAFVDAKLQSFGCDIVERGIGRIGIVAIIKGAKGDGPSIGLRADMDALPLEEISEKPWKSQVPGKMHACGHDGHMAMLLEAARHLAQTRNFSGSVAIVFQPAEEGGGGALSMLKDNMMGRFGITKIFGMHSRPGIDIGNFSIRSGPILAACDTFNISISGQGGHAAQPHKTVDTISASAYVILALQGLVSRQADSTQALVISITSIHGGTSYNVIPENIQLKGTARTTNPEFREFIARKIPECVKAAVSIHGATADIIYNRGYPVTVNHPAETEFAINIVHKICGKDAIHIPPHPFVGSEDFSYMLEARPGSFIFIGNGDTAELHNSSYDFNDDAIPYGISYWVTLVESALST